MDEGAGLESDRVIQAKEGEHLALMELRPAPHQQCCVSEGAGSFNIALGGTEVFWRSSSSQKSAKRAMFQCNAQCSVQHDLKHCVL